MSLETEKNLEEGQTKMADKPEQETEEINQEVEDALPEQDFDGTDQLIVEQQKRIQELEEELNKVKDSQLRKAAEMENMRKRMRREREQIFRTLRLGGLAGENRKPRAL